MTTPPQPDPAAEKPVGQFLRPLRDLATYALVGAVAVFLLVDIINGFRSDFIGGYPWSSGGIVGLETVLFPIAAVLLALAVPPVHTKAKVITLVALVEYGLAALFGVIFDVFFGVSKIAAMDAGVAFTALLARAAWLALLAVPAYAVVQIWLGLFNVPKPKPAPGVYGQPYGQPPFGQPQYGPPQQYGQTPPPAAPYQPGVVPPPPAAQTYGQPVATQPFNPQAAPYGQYPAVPAPPPPGWGQPPVSGAPAVPFAEPTQAVPPTSGPPAYTPPTSAPPAYTPSVSAPPASTPPASTPPASAPPASTPPASAPPASAPPASAPPASAPSVSAPPAATPVVRTPTPEGDTPTPVERTEVLPQDRPGFGPADQDPPRQ